MRRRPWAMPVRLTSAVAVATLVPQMLVAQSSDSLRAPRWALDAAVVAGASAWSQPVLSSRMRSRPAGGYGVQLSHVHSPRWRGVVGLDVNTRGAIGDDWSYRTRYTELSALVMAELFAAGPLRVALGGGPVAAWAGKGIGVHRADRQLDVTLDPSSPEWSARVVLEGRVPLRLPISGRITFQRGLMRVLQSNPAAAQGRWDGTTPPYSKLLGFELGATLLRW